jgi:hypothetical protein
MRPNPLLNRVCLLVMGHAAAAAAFLLFTGQYAWTLLPLALAFSMVRTRKYMGYRGPRQAVFASHMALTSAFVVALLLVIFVTETLWARSLVQVAFLGAALTGILLIRQSWHVRES